MRQNVPVGGGRLPAGDDFFIFVELGLEPNGAILRIVFHSGGETVLSFCWVRLHFPARCLGYQLDRLRPVVDLERGGILQSGDRWLQKQVGGNCATGQETQSAENDDADQDSDPCFRGEHGVILTWTRTKGHLLQAEV